MSVSVNHLLTSGNNADATSYTTGSVNPGADRLVLVWVYSIAGAAPNTPTLSGNGLTYVQVASVIDSNSLRRLTLFRAMGASPSSGGITIDFAGQTQTGCVWSVAEFLDVDTSGTNGSGAIVQSDTEASAGNVSSLTSTLGAFASTDNATVGGFGYPLNNGNGTVGTGFTQIGEHFQASPNQAIFTEFRNDNDTTVNASIGASSVPMVAISAEIKSGASNFTSSVTLTNTTTLTAAGKPTYRASVSISSTTTLEAVGFTESGVVPVTKRYLYKIYDSDDNFLGIWDDVRSDLSYDYEINSAGSMIEVILGRSADSRVAELEELNTSHSAEVITTQDSNTLIMQTTTTNAVGSGTLVDINLGVRVWVFYGWVESLLTSSNELILTNDDNEISINIGAVNGQLKFHGYITKYAPKYGGEENVSVSVASFGRDLEHAIFTVLGMTTVEYLNTEVSTLVTDITNENDGGEVLVHHTDESVDNTGTTPDFVVRNNTYLEMLQLALKLAPFDWWFRIGLGDDTIYFKPKPSEPSHYFYLGKHIQEMSLDYTIEGLVNTIYFTGGEVAGSNLYVKYTDAASVTSYRRGLKRLSDHRVTLQDTADTIADGELTRNAEPRHRTSVTILSEAYDIESIEVGQTVGFKNFGNYVDSLELQIVAMRYEPDRVTLQLDTLRPNVSKRVDDLKRALAELENTNVPDTPL